eukprot:8377015-Karenia_brevis.AAC.1
MQPISILELRNVNMPIIWALQGMCQQTARNMDCSPASGLEYIVSSRGCSARTLASTIRKHALLSVI